MLIVGGGIAGLTLNRRSAMALVTSS